MRKYRKWIALFACVLLLAANISTGQAAAFDIDDTVVSMGTTYWDLSPGEEYAFFVVRQGANTASSIAAEDILYMNQAASNNYGTLSFVYLPNAAVTAQTELRGNSTRNAVELTWMFTDEGNLKLIASDSIPTFETAPWASVQGKVSGMVMPASVEQISSFLFRGCTNLKTITFEGDAPDFDPDAFAGVTATVFYPLENPTWTEDVRQNYGGNITWAGGHTHVFGQWVVTIPATTSSTGQEKRVCTNCGEAEFRTIDKLSIRFEDVSDTAYYAIAVNWAVDNGITNGLDATHFGPDNGCTRAHVVTFLWRAAGSPAPASSNNPFTDVAPGAYYYDAVLWAVEQGITNGTSPTTFAPDATCTRGQIVTFLWRYRGSPAATGSGSFTDVPKDQYYSTAVTWAVDNSITNGMGDGLFAPDATCTRGQIVTFLYRAMKA